MSVESLAIVLATLDEALAGLHAEADWQPGDALGAILARRRHSVRLVRRALMGSDPTALRALPGPIRPRGTAPGDRGGLLRGKEPLAAFLDGWIATLPPTHTHRALALHLRSETDDAARVLRVMISAVA